MRPSRNNFMTYVLLKMMLLRSSYKITILVPTDLYYQTQKVWPAIHFKPTGLSMYCPREFSLLSIKVIRTRIVTPILQMRRVRKRVFNDIHTQTFTWSINITFNLIRRPSRQESHTKRHQNFHAGPKTLQTANPLI